MTDSFDDGAESPVSTLLVPGTTPDRPVPLSALPGGLVAHPGGWRGHAGHYESVILKVDTLAIEMSPHAARKLVTEILKALQETA